MAATISGGVDGGGAPRALPHHGNTASDKNRTRRNGNGAPSFVEAPGDYGIVPSGGQSTTAKFSGHEEGIDRGDAETRALDAEKRNTGRECLKMSHVWNMV